MLVIKGLVASLLGTKFARTDYGTYTDAATAASPYEKEFIEPPFTVIVIFLEITQGKEDVSCPRVRAARYVDPGKLNLGFRLPFAKMNHILCGRERDIHARKLV